MHEFDLQGIALDVPAARAFAYIADPAQLPRWTNAFARVADGRALLRTPAGEAEVTLGVHASAEHGTVDWRIEFADGSVVQAHSRVVPLARGRCAYSFVLPPPPDALQGLEGTLAAQSRSLSQELRRLKETLEHAG